MEPKQIGRYLIDSGVITEKQLEVALAAQVEEAAKKSPPRLIGVILVEQGLIGHGDISAALVAQQNDRAKKID